MYAAKPSHTQLADHFSVSLNSVSLGFWQMHVEDRCLICSDETCVLLGVSQNNRQLLFEVFLSYVHPDDHEELERAITQAFQEQSILNIGLRIIKPGSDLRHVQLRGEPWRSTEGNSVYFGVLQDISEQISRQHEAEQNALLLQIASRISRIGGWRLDLTSGEIKLSDEVCRIHELPPGCSLSIETAIAFYAPEWRDTISYRLEACIHGGLPYDEELQIITTSGRRVWVRTICEPVFDKKNKIIRIQGAFQDITDKKIAEEATRRLEQRLATTLDSITDAFYTLDGKWRFTYLNKEAERLFQRPREKLLGKELWEEFSALKGHFGEREFHRAIRENCAVVFEEYYAPYRVWSEVRAFPTEEGLAVYFRDITQARNIHESLRISEERFRLIAKSTNDALWDWDIANGTTWRGEKFQNLLGYALTDFDGSVDLWADRIHPDDRQRILDDLDAAVAGDDDNWRNQYRFLRKDGSIAFVLDRGCIIRDDTGKATRMVGAMVDYTERREAEARLREQASLLDKAKDAIVIRGIDNKVHYWNKGAERLYGWTAEEVLGRSVEDLLYQGSAEFPEAMRWVLELGEWSGEITQRRKDGTLLPAEVQWTLMHDDAGQPQSIFAIKTDISRRKAAERRIHYLAYYDSLTRLPNRQLLMERLQEAMAASKKSGSVNALLFIDLDNFKTLNDTLGHDFGDLLLQQVAQRLTDCAKNNDTVARFGGDEFVVLASSIGDDLAEAAAHARLIGGRIIEALSPSFQLEEYQHDITPSIGVTLFGGEENDAGELLKHADMAMYQAKAAGRNTVRFFDPDMQAAASARRLLEADLRHALRERQFFLQYQPQVDRHDNIIGVEALVRWQHPSRGIVSPGKFIPLAEDTGLILPLGEWVLESACRQLAAWTDDPGMMDMEIAVNVSASQFHHPGFVSQVLGIVNRTGARLGRLKLEIMESLLLEKVEDAISKMNALKVHGISFALDDFGTGYSSLAYLKRLPLDMLKIDASFVHDMLTNPNDAVIARSIIALGCNLGLKIIAEGVEDQDQRDFLFQHGCDAYQGYLCSAPLPAADIAKKICDKPAGTF